MFESKVGYFSYVLPEEYKDMDQPILVEETNELDILPTEENDKKPSFKHIDAEKQIRNKKYFQLSNYKEEYIGLVEPNRLRKFAGN